MNPLIIGLLAWLLYPKQKSTGKGMSKTFDSIIRKAATGAGYSRTLGDLLVAQAKVESGNYTNNAFRKSKNAFGYKFFAGAKYQTGKKIVKSSESDFYADYSSLKNATLEVIAWLQRRQAEGKFKIIDLTTPITYARALKAGYYYGGTPDVYAKAMQQYL